jgi:hypothetical protein
MAGLRDIGPRNVKFASFGGSGTTSIVAAVTGKKIVCISFMVKGTAAATITFKSATTAITGAMNLGIAAGMSGSDTVSPLVGPYNPDGHFQTASGEALQITDSAGTAAGYVTYFET